MEAVIRRTLEGVVLTAQFPRTCILVVLQVGFVAAEPQEVLFRAA
jgi:hypothetical protein